MTARHRADGRAGHHRAPSVWRAPRALYVVLPLAVACAVLFAMTTSGAEAGLPATRAAAIYLQVNPSAAAPGKQVGLRASCDDNLKVATVDSELTGSVPVNPQYGLLTATIGVPAEAAAGTYQLTLHCPGGESAVAELTVTRDGSSCPETCATPTPSTPPPCPDACDATTPPPCPDACDATTPPPQVCTPPPTTTSMPTPPPEETTEPTPPPEETTEPTPSEPGS
ncbi:hypothetical protein ACQPZX_20925 [Actinoplanes sp. CA-142083]|uniref:hypothetical protein n=1 Tax=Actinoplanes sp. CA-142083 TaxID=3239903 RepID=UPI003D90867D